MKNVSINTKQALKHIPTPLVEAVSEQVYNGYKTLIRRNGPGNDFLGWMDLPVNPDKKLLERIKNDVNEQKKKSDIIVVIGIGGSYLGARAVTEALNFSRKPSFPEIAFAGNNLNALDLSLLMDKLDKRNYSIVVISKSGTTTEPAIAFRILRQHLIKKYGENEAANRIIAITDKSRGTLKNLSDMCGYPTYIIPDDVGGRFSVLTPVGLLPIALAGYDIEKILEGAGAIAEMCLDENQAIYSPAYQYAIARNVLYAAGFDIEILVNYLDNLNYVSEWWKQLYGESEGKDGKGLFPASVSNTTDLHSLGQFIQGGTRKLFETVLQVDRVKYDITVPEIDGDIDNLNYVAGKSLHQINKIAQKATTSAHLEGGVPNITIAIPQISEYSLGQLIYMFEFACGISGYTIEVNPFDQPDVENYKSKMKKLLKG
ncbi:MAG: glucose-6-phosphate isomerase [Bacteroidales bacterium]|nr:glucose-6-phosphate isomerase [Bacteroidales bacterium]MBR6491562.1 glucose-6-phosphate isomerase [Bacteroidales bacterium]